LVAPQLTALISLIDEDNTAKNLPVQTSVNNAGQIIGPLIGTLLAGKQISVLFMVSSGLLVIPVFVILWNKRR